MEIIEFNATDFAAMPTGTALCLVAADGKGVTTDYLCRAEAFVLLRECAATTSWRWPANWVLRATSEDEAAKLLVLEEKLKC